MNSERNIARIVGITIGLLMASRVTVGQTKDNEVDLNGIWKTNSGETILIVQTGRVVDSQIVSGGDCYAGVRSFFIKGQLEDETLSGSLMRCNPQVLVDEGGYDPHWETKFTASLTGDDTLSGVYQGEFITWDTDDDGNKVNFHVDHEFERDFSLTRSQDSCEDLIAELEQRIKTLRSRLEIEKQLADMYSTRASEMFGAADQRFAEGIKQILTVGLYQLIRSFDLTGDAKLALTLRDIENAESWEGGIRALLGGLNAVSTLLKNRSSVAEFGRTGFQRTVWASVIIETLDQNARLLVDARALESAYDTQHEWMQKNTATLKEWVEAMELKSQLEESCPNATPSTHSDSDTGDPLPGEKQGDKAALASVGEALTLTRSVTENLAESERKLIQLRIAVDAMTMGDHSSPKAHAATLSEGIVEVTGYLASALKAYSDARDRAGTSKIAAAFDTPKIVVSLSR